MNTQKHWDKIYHTKAPDQVSWFQGHLETSLAMIESVSRGDLRTSIIDVGAGASTLVDDLLDRGFRNITLLDVSEAALQLTRNRLPRPNSVRFLVGDVTAVTLGTQSYDIWHDRAVFHFLTNPAARAAYVRNLASTLRPGGHVILSTFGPEGPKQCSGLDVARYSPHELHDEFGARFQLVQSSMEMHRTPTGAKQQFVYCLCRLDR